MKRSVRALLAALLLTLLAPGWAGSATIAGNTVNDSFNNAKRMLEQNVYHDHRVTLYCGAPYDARKNVALPPGFRTPGFEKRALKVEWEHSVPAEHFGQTFPEWREGAPLCVGPKGRRFKGRKCAEAANAEYRYMQADMYNLFPAIGAVNAVRSNYPYDELPGISGTFGSCEAKTDGRRFEPPARAKGAVARAAFYMEAAYPRYQIGRRQRQLFEAWNRLYPVDQWECTRTRRIERLQGNENPFVKRPCQELGMW